MNSNRILPSRIRRPSRSNKRIRPWFSRSLHHRRIKQRRNRQHSKPKMMKRKRTQRRKRRRRRKQPNKIPNRMNRRRTRAKQRLHQKPRKINHPAGKKNQLPKRLLKVLRRKQLPQQIRPIKEMLPHPRAQRPALLPMSHRRLTFQRKHSTTRKKS